MIKVDILKDILVLVFVYIPPLIVFIRFWRERNKSKLLLVLISLLYLIFSLFTQNLLPFILIVFNIRYLKNADKDSNIFRGKYISSHGISSRIREDYSRFKFSIRSFSIITAVKNTMFSYFITILISAVEMAILSRFRMEVNQQEIVTAMENMPLKRFLIMIPVVIIFAPILEEFVFRWLFFEKIFIPRIGIYISALLSSIIFAFIHFNMKAFPMLLWIGLYNCYLIHKKGYWYSVFNHFTFNFITILALLIPKISMLKL